MATLSTLQLSHELGIGSRRADCIYSSQLKGLLRKNRLCHLKSSLSSCALLSHELGIGSRRADCIYSSQLKGLLRKNRLCHLKSSLSSCALKQDAWTVGLSWRLRQQFWHASSRGSAFTCRSFMSLSRASEIPIMKAAAVAFTKSYTAWHGKPLLLQLIPAVGIIAFAIWGLGPLIRQSRSIFLQRSDSNWKKSRTYYVMTSYLQPILLWIGATLICRVLDPVVLPTEASQVVKQRLLNFVRSLSTVLAFAYCLSSLIQQSQKFFMEGMNSNDARNMGFDFAGKAIYTAVWVAAVSLFMELLGFSTQKWLTAGGLGTVLLTLAGREIFTNFLSSVMIHATRPFVINEWIQTKIEGYEVSGTVEHVGWWSPTIIRGEDREAVHIPNHKFTMNVVRNLSQKTHWRIKTHLAISHLDVNKINNIVADMRKVLAKNPQVEQQRLHRRVFLDNVNPENQALLIMVSCFVKTSHFEEYLCVKEAIFLDLLRVISHHRARLATPIRTVQKIYGDANVENIPFSETIFTRSGAATNRPFLLIEPSTRINGDDKTKVRSTRSNEERDSKVSATPDGTKATRSGSESSSQTGSGKQTKKTNIGDARTKSTKIESPQPLKPQLEGTEPVDPKSKDGTQPAVALEKNPDSEKPETISKSESDRLPAAPSPTARSTLKENIVLGVALEGSKRTLPIEEEMSPPTPADAKELAACRNTNGPAPSSKDKKDGQGPSIGVQRDQER